MDKNTDTSPGIHEGASNKKCFFFQKEKEIVEASPDGLVTHPSKNNVPKVIEAKNVIVIDDETLKDSPMKSKCRLLDTGLKVKRESYCKIPL